jgi:hypothetical protein
MGAFLTRFAPDLRLGQTVKATKKAVGYETIRREGRRQPSHQ